MRSTRTAHSAIHICTLPMNIPIMIPSPISVILPVSPPFQASCFYQTEIISVARPMTSSVISAGESRIFTSCAMRIRGTISRRGLATATHGRMGIPALIDQQVLIGREPETVQSTRQRTIMQICKRSGWPGTIPCLPDFHG